MFTDCPSCTRTYQLNRAALGCSGRTVVCPGCAARWYVAVPEADGEVAAVAPPPALGREDRREPAATRPRRVPGANLRPIVVGLAGLLLASGLLAKRATVVGAIPRTAAFYAAIGLPVNVRGLGFGEVRMAWPQDGASRVAVTGRIRNLTGIRASVPRIAFDLRDAKGTVLASWSESPPRRVLAANEIVPFTATQVPNLPEGVKDVLVHFTDGGRDRVMAEAASR